MLERNYDKYLHIETSKYSETFDHSNVHYHRYEPTPYSALQVLFEHHKIVSSDRIVDFGCGKGRLIFFIHYFYQATVIGIEMNQSFYESARNNSLSYIRQNQLVKHDNIHLYHCLAEGYQINENDNKFYFFNPFTVQIFMRIINNILRSVEKNPREIELIIYYGSDDYVYFLNYQTTFSLKQEIAVPILVDSNPYERFLVYRLG
ncbi:SAM-dependent methyltransferase [Aquibacillus koreensis]|uniref:SAM-dependent methyltransferase n=1 Tax=Aquibacillus koreensis TaxID=279446 RepID=A0A9X3WK89_9BACI|nr:SAM-dependent methyltransferase [Aquibacillus koreensis]MCT2537488.1 SAM-dependent methyltransferase [Aquibacillus koreensis]MDC3418934.1 SAM-dependent methyltransferase [Aquibacillus koreensis]